MKTIRIFAIITFLLAITGLGYADPTPTGYVSPSSITDDTTVVTFYRAGTCNNGFGWSEATLWKLSGYIVLGNFYGGINAYQPLNTTGGPPGAPLLSQGPGTYSIQYRLVDVYQNYTDQWITVSVNKYSVPDFADSVNLPAWAYDAQTFWNDTSVQPYNRCYNYATNTRTDTQAQPGKAHGYYPYYIDAANVATAVAYDGLPSSDPGDGSAKIAMLIDAGHDFHFVRLDNAGNWSHKRGTTAAQDLDASNAPISDPTAANWYYYDPYFPFNYSFSQYFYTPSEVIQGSGHAVIN